MPVDPALLRKYDPRPPPTKPPREGQRAYFVASVGTPLILLAAWGADGNVALAGTFIVLTIVAVLGAGAVLFYIGYQEDGLIGALFVRSHPLGSELTPGDSPSWMRFAVGWLIVLSCILSIVLVSRTPDAWPAGLFHRHRVAGPTLRDRLLD